MLIQVTSMPQGEQKGLKDGVISGVGKKESGPNKVKPKLKKIRIHIQAVSSEAHVRGNVACNSPKKVALYRFSVSLLIGFPGKNPFRYVSSSSPDLSHSLSLLRFQFPKIKLFSSNANRRRVLSLEFEKSRIEIGRCCFSI
ncbi:hypothetical protein MRB53_034160 [Persea americana]|uniref:Uncharacterized protein n=1 Tax=Persea americana TaxID=3435 RepID=A0ACC2KX23_PERAE|nr:hypothetical protein MRB53_034160 [Persea americana]